MSYCLFKEKFEVAKLYTIPMMVTETPTVATVTATVMETILRLIWN